METEAPRVLLPLGAGIPYRAEATTLSLPARTVDRRTSEAQFLEHLPRIEKTIGALARRHGFRDAEADDLASWIKLRLIEDDYDILRKFRGESSIATYLTVVIATLVQDYKIKLWGRWRASAAALRKGKVAVTLEALVYRQGYQPAHAAELMRSRGDTDLGDRELGAMLNELPRRGPPRPQLVGEEDLAAAPSASSAEEAVEHEAAANERTTVEAALRAVIGRMPPEDQCILTMRFWRDMGVADIARALDVPQKPLYRRLERVLGELRRELMTLGITSERAHTLVSEMTP